MFYNQEVSTDYIKENKLSVVISAISSLWLVVWFYLTNDTFHWVDIEIFSAPPYVRVIYSLITFFTIWAFLYYIRFYQLFYNIFVRWLWNMRVYRKVKAWIWWFLLFLMFFYIVPTLIDCLNYLSCLAYNFVWFILYIIPWIWIPIVIFSWAYLIGLAIKFWQEKSNPN